MPAKSALLNLMDRVAAADSLQVVYDSALHCLHETLGVERASVLVLDDEQVMRFAAWTGLSDAYRRAVDGHSAWPPDETDAAPVLVEDVRHHPDFAAYGTVFDRERIRALAFVPLRFGSKLLGKFMLYYREPHTFSADEVTIAETIAGHIAFALEHRRIAEELASRLGAEQAARRDAEQEAALRLEHERRLNLALSAGAMGTWDWDVAHGRIRWSEQLEAIHGLEPGTFGGTIEDFQSDMHPDDRARVLEAIEQAVGGGQSDYEIEYRIVRPDGVMSWIAAKGRLLYDAQGRPSRMVGICSDVSQRKRAELERSQLYRQAQSARAAAERAREQLQILAEVSDDLASSLDPDEALQQLAGHAVAKLADYCITYALEDGRIRRLGFAHRIAHKLPLAEALADAGPPTLTDAAGAGAVIRTGRDIFVEHITEQMLDRTTLNARHLEVVRKLDPCSTIIVALRARGATLGAISLVTTADSGRRYDHQDLELARELASRAALLVDNARLFARARSAIAARDDMIAVVSHDLRSPLQSIATAAAALRLEPPPQQRSRSMETIALATSQVDRLLQDLLDISQIEGGQLSIDRQLTEPAALIDEARALFQPLATHRGVQLRCTVAPDLPVLQVDRNRMQQVLANLLGNALKFVRAGGRIELSAARDDGKVRIAVVDDGTGIEAEHLPRIFDRFWRSNRSSERGIGLGLAVAKGIVEAHGGLIGVESRIGEGSTFYVLLEGEAPSAGGDEPARLRVEAAADEAEPQHGTGAGS